MRIKIFRREILKGVHNFVFQDKIYQVLDDVAIYHADSDTLYILDLDF